MLLGLTPQGLGVVLPDNSGTLRAITTKPGMLLPCGVVLETMRLRERTARAWVLTLPVSL